MTGYKCTISILAVSLIWPCWGHPQAAAEDRVSGFVVGGAASRPDYEGSSDPEPVPLFAAEVNYKFLSLRAFGDDVELDISPYESLEFGPIASFRSGRGDDVENVTVGRLRQIDDALEAGVFGKLTYQSVFTLRDQLSFGAEFLADTSGTHDGYVATFGVGYDRQMTDRFGIGLDIKSRYASEDYMNTYFSIDADNALRSGLPLYQAGSGIKDVDFQISAEYMLTQNWGIVGIASHKHLLGDAADSPVVAIEGDEAQQRFGVGLRFKF
ncbi:MULTISPECIES: MipA/OmpV family protein [Hyphomonas]|uniref:MipA/OmpV family protein n=1 Tax=Hyphomonas TaxID=85 RepID=UPI000A01D451|nr:MULTISPECIES: MipA/OmpV family protein [Hyphomonas]